MQPPISLSAEKIVNSKHFIEHKFLIPTVECALFSAARQTVDRCLQISHQTSDIFRPPRALGEEGVDRSHFITNIIGRLFPHLFDCPVDPFFPLGGESGGVDVDLIGKLTDEMPFEMAAKNGHGDKKPQQIKMKKENLADADVRTGGGRYFKLPLRRGHFYAQNPFDIGPQEGAE